MNSSETIFIKLKKLLSLKGVLFDILEHETAGPSNDSALARRKAGGRKSTGAKAIVVSYNKHSRFALLVIPGTRRLDSKKTRKILKKFSFASLQQLEELTGLQPGEIPPFGRPITKIDRVLVDCSLKQSEWLSFNAGRLDTSIYLRSKDYFEIVTAETVDVIEKG